MSIVQTLLNGEQGLFKPKTLTPMQKLTLRFVVVGLVYYGFAVIEGMIMRIYEVEPIPFITTEPVLRHPDGPPARRHLRVDLLDRLRRLPLPGAVPDEEAAVELQAGQLDLLADRRRHLRLLGRGLRLPLRAPLHALLAAPGRLQPVQRPRRRHLHPGHRPGHAGHGLLRHQHLQDHHLHSQGLGQAAGRRPPGLGPRLDGHQEPLPEEEGGAPRAPAGGRRRPRHGGRGPQLRHHPVHRGPHPRLHGRGAPRHEPQAHGHRRPALQELVLVGPRPRRRRPRPHLRRRHLVSAGHADHGQGAVHAEHRPGRPARRARRLLDGLVAPPAVRPGPAGHPQGRLRARW